MSDMLQLVVDVGTGPPPDKKAQMYDMLQLVVAVETGPLPDKKALMSDMLQLVVDVGTGPPPDKKTLRVFELESAGTRTPSPHRFTNHSSRDS